MTFNLVDLRQTTDITLLAAFAALFLPYLIALLSSPRWPSWLKGLVTHVIYGAVGVTIAFWQGSLDRVPDLAAAIVPIFLVATLKYSFLDRPSGLAPRLEYLTSKRDFRLYAQDQLLKNAPDPTLTPPAEAPTPANLAAAQPLSPSEVAAQADHPTWTSTP